MKVTDIISERVAPQGGMGLTIFDIDDTLFHTTAQIKVVKDGKVVRSLTNQEFNTYNLQPGEEFDFGEFRNAEKFARESKPIKPMINTLKRILNRASNTKVIMLTARADFDDKDKFLDTFEKYGIDMSRIHVHRAGNLPGDDPPAYKKAIWVRKYLNTGKYNRVNLIDDSMSNLKVFKSLKREYPQVDFDAYFVGPTGGITVVESWNNKSNINEKIGDVSQFAEPGDTIYSIARQNNLDPVELMKFNGFTKDTKLQKGQEVKIPQKKSAAPATTSKKTAPVVGQGAQPATITGSTLETTLRNFAIKAGIKGKELAQFLAQCAHETMNYSSLVELGDNYKNYDPKVNPSKAKTLGNTTPGDGERFKGRGYIQLTGRWNYTQAGQALGIPLDQKPQLLERPDVAAKASVWFWKNRVQPNVSNFTDTRTVTGYINPGLAGLQQRNGLFKNYLQTMGSSKVKESDTDEDYHPNDTPAGPETKPTMPAGTVRVDVSDVYDWYKLGQHISNLKGLGKHDFGKGPPSTIISFGSEEEEHEYLQDLMKLGLATTDIDPVDPKQPKNMKRQKTDPTYNVGENFADGRNPQDKGDSKRHGIPKKASISTLKSIRSSKTASPRKKQLAHWQINMRQGKKKE
jgi:putative chitinase